MPGVDASAVGQRARLDVAGLARVAEGRVVGVRAIRDRFGTAAALARQP